MYYSEVEDWLISIGLAHLFPYFIEDGFTNLESVRNMRQADIDSIVDRHGYMIILNEEIDKLNYTPVSHSMQASAQSHRNSSRPVELSNYENDNYGVEPIESVMKRYEVSRAPSVGFVSQHLARRARSKSTRGMSVLPNGRESSVGFYLPNSASQEFENLMLANRRAQSVVPQPVSSKKLTVAETFALLERNSQNVNDRSSRARSEMHYSDLPADNLDRGKFRDHYTNEYVWVEKNHITDVGVKYDGLSRRVDHKPSHWRCEDEIERGKEYKRMNDEYADRIADNRLSIDNSRDWLTNDGGVIDRVHRMSAQTQKTRYDLDSIKRNMDNLKAMRTRLLKQ